MTPSSAATAQPSSPVALDEDLVARELVARGAESSRLELLELAGSERGTHGSELLAELRAEDGAGSA